MRTFASLGAVFSVECATFDASTITRSDFGRGPVSGRRAPLGASFRRPRRGVSLAGGAGRGGGSGRSVATTGCGRGRGRRVPGRASSSPYEPRSLPRRTFATPGEGGAKGRATARPLLSPYTIHGSCRAGRILLPTSLKECVGRCRIRSWSAMRCRCPTRHRFRRSSDSAESAARAAGGSALRWSPA